MINSVKRFLIKSSIVLIAVVQLIPAAKSSEVCNAEYVGVDGFVPGKCVTFHECPPLLKLIKSPRLTSSELKLLQNLTCRIVGEIPTICCAIKDVKDLVNYNEEARPNQGSSAIVDILIYPPAPENSGSRFGPSHSQTSNSAEATSSEELGDKIGQNNNNPTNAIRDDEQHDIKLRTNFKLLPKLNECGSPHAVGTTDRIIGGENAQHAAYPWMARIGYLALKTGEIEFYCGATVINKKYVLTAAHCTEELDQDYYMPAIVRLGEYDSEEDLDCSEALDCSRAVDLKIEKVVPHPGYDPVNKTDDIELIRVRGTIPFDTPFVKPICLPFAKDYGVETYIKEDLNQFAGKKGVVTGWGRTQWDKQDGSRYLQEVTLPIVTNEECQRNYSKKIDLWEKQMCAGGQTDRDSCGGDSGGPISVAIPMRGPQNSRPSAKYFQLGVVSFGPTHCGVGNLPGVYTRIAAYKDWILENLEK